MFCKEPYSLVVSKGMMYALMTVVVRGPAKRAERFGFALNFLLSFFLSREKRRKHKLT